MKRLTAGIAREIVDTSKTAGEAWYRLTDGFYGRNVQGATAITSQLQELKRPTQIAESFHLLNVIRKLVREFARQSPKAMPSAIVKAAYVRVVPETYRRAMETQVDVDKVEPHNLEDKVLAFIRNNTSGAAPMDMGIIAGLGSSNQSTTSSSHGGSDSYPDLNYYEYAAQWGQDWNSVDADTSGCSDGELYGLQKGNGKGKSGSFNGICYNCGKSGHSAKFCYAKGGKAKGKEQGKKGDIKGWNDSKGWTVGKGWSEGKGWNTSGKGWEQRRPAGMNNLERDSNKYDVLVMETSTKPWEAVTGAFSSNALPNSAAWEDRHQPRQTSISSLIQRKRTEKMTQHRIVWGQNSSPWKTVSVTNAASVRLGARSGTGSEISPPRSQVYVFPARQMQTSISSRRGIRTCASFNKTLGRHCQSLWLSIQEMEKQSWQWIGWQAIFWL